MAETRLHTCMLCEATCGIVVEVDGDKLVRLRADADDPFSRGHICPKAAALDDVRTDPDRVVRPLRRDARGLSPVSWDTALDEIADRIARIQDEHGKSAVAVYTGNPVAHTYSGLLGGLVLAEALGSRARFSATSLDQLPHMLASLEMFGHQLLLPVPDVDRTEHMLILGANPVVSNGSLMTAPGIAARLEGVRARGGKVVVVDPRRTETAELADEHHFIRPGTDAFLLLAMLSVIFAENRARLGRLAEFTRGAEDLARACEAFTPARVAGAVGIDASAIERMARELAAARRAVVYGRVGLCTQEHGGVAAWLVNALNVVTGNLDREGGAMFTTPAADVVRLASMIGQKGHFGVWRSRVRGLPEFSGELPAAALAEEIETPGEGQIRALVTLAGNPVLSSPNGSRLEKALSKLDLMVSIDIYKNETTRHAHYVLPTTFGLERDHFDLALYLLGVRNAARYVEPVFAPAGEARHDFDVLADLAHRVSARRRGVRAKLVSPVLGALRRLGPKRALDLLLRTSSHRLSLHKLRRAPHGVDLGALEPRLPERLYTADKKIQLAPALFTSRLPELAAQLDSPRAARGLALIGRRQLRSNNSWMHNSQRLVKGRERCTLLMHPDDARARGVKTGDFVRVTSRAGSARAPVEVTDEVARGVVSLPHGWGHAREGVELRVARAHAGASVNDVTDEALVDPLSGTAAFSGVDVEVVREESATTGAAAGEEISP